MSVLSEFEYVSNLLLVGQSFDSSFSLAKPFLVLSFLGAVNAVPVLGAPPAFVLVLSGQITSELSCLK